MRKAQASIFIILGIIIVAATLIFFFIKGSIEREEIAPGLSMIVEELPTEFLPLRPFVENCIQKTATEGLIKLGNSGGYIYTAALKPGKEGTDGDSITFSSNSDLVVPYWFYMDSDNNCAGKCSFSSRQINLRQGRGDSIEGQLSRYVDEKLNECIDSFNGLKELNYNVEELGRAKSKVVVASSNLVISLEYPVRISREGISSEVRNFHSSLDVNLEKIYNAAEYLAGLQKDYRFLEQQALNIIVGFSAKDKEKLPPMSDSAFEVGSKTRWRKAEVRNSVSNLLSSYVPVLRVEDSVNWKEIDTGDAFIDELYNSGMTIPRGESTDELLIDFNYLGFWKEYFNLNCNGEICKPESAFIDLLPIGLQRYNFVYDISYPVLVEIEDESAFNERGYTFRFMLESNVRDNKAVQATYIPYPTQGGNSDECDESTWSSGTATITIKDSFTGEGIDEADAVYTCVEESCSLGKTEDGELITKLPVCLGGTIRLLKEGYGTSYTDYDMGDRDSNLEINMNPERIIKVEIRKKLLMKDNNGWALSSAVRGLSTDEEAVISVDDSSNLLNISGNIDTELPIAEGLHTFDIELLTENLYIPSETKEIDDEDYYINATNISSFVSGRATVSFTITKEHLQKGRLILYALAVDKNEIKVHDDLQVLGEFETLAEKYKEDLVPTVE